MPEALVSQSWRARLSSAVAAEFRPDRLSRSVLSGTVLYLLQIIILVSFALYIFHGDLAESIGYGIAYLFVGSAVLGAIAALFSAYRGAVAAGQDVPAAILAVAAVALEHAMHDAPPESQFATALALIVLTSLATGLCFVLVGYFKLGGLARFLPYPVMGGFLAGTGWMLIIGAFEVVTHAPPGPSWITPDAVIHWLPAVVLGVVLLIVTRHSGHPLVLPGLLGAATLLFYFIALVSQWAPADLEAKGWMLGMLPPAVAWQAPSGSDYLSHVDWGALAGGAGVLAPLVIVSMIAFLLNANSLELHARHDIDLDRELMVMGAANLAGGLGGGIVGYTFVDLTTAGESAAGGGRRLPGIVASLLLVLTVAVGAPFLQYLPVFVLGGLLVFLGASLLIEWVYEAWHRFPKVDFGIIVLILAVIALRGFLEGVAVGLAATIALFVVSYSRINVVKHALSGTVYRSRVVRSVAERQLLSGQGQRLAILRLQGFIFFGTANHLLDRVRALSAGNAVRFVILDFAHVHGLDSTGLLSFRKMLNLARERAFTVVLSGLGVVGVQSSRLEEQFRRSELLEESEQLRVFGDLDHAIEWCENTLIAEANVGHETSGLLALLPPDQLARLKSVMERLEEKPGERLIRQGAPPDYLYMVESGQLTTELDTPDGHRVRLETMRGAQFIGEIGFLMNTPRSASVFVDEPAVVYRLARRDLERLRRDDPETAFILQDVISRSVGQRVQQLLRLVEVLQQ